MKQLYDCVVHNLCRPSVGLQRVKLSPGVNQQQQLKQLKQQRMQHPAINSVLSALHCCPDKRRLYCLRHAFLLLCYGSVCSVMYAV